MENEIFIHLGVPKTGSTLLQTKLFPKIKNIKYLGRYYGTDNNNLFNKLDNYIENDRSSKEIDINEIINELNTYTNKYKRILISNENWIQPTSIKDKSHQIFVSNFWIKLERINNIMKNINAKISYFGVSRDQVEAIPSFFSTIHYRLINLFGYQMKNIDYYVKKIIENKDLDNDLSLFFDMYNYQKISTFFLKKFNKKIIFFNYSSLVDNKKEFLNNILTFLKIENSNSYEMLIEDKIRETKKKNDNYVSKIQISKTNIFFFYLNKILPEILKRSILKLFKYLSFYPSGEVSNKISRKSLDLIKTNYL